MRHPITRNPADTTGPDAGTELSTQLEPDFSHVDAAARISVSVVRTLRIPDDGRVGTVPSGLGRLPMIRVPDLDRGIPARWTRDRGILTPVYQSEALRLLFETPTGYPFAVKVLADGRNVTTGKGWRPGLAESPRNHVVVPGAHHLDRIPGRGGRLRQLAASPLKERGTDVGVMGDAFTMAALQLVVTPMKRESWRDLGPGFSDRPPPTHTDGAGADRWDARHTQTCFVRFVPAQYWRAVTGQVVPHPPISRDLYHGAGVPWPEWFQADHEVRHQGRSLRELNEPGWGKTG